MKNITSNPVQQSMDTGAKIATESLAYPETPAIALWLKCPMCKSLLYHKNVVRNLKVCPECGHHSRLSWKERLASLLDKDTFVPLNEHLEATDPLKFSVNAESYATKLQGIQRKTELQSALVTGYGFIRGHPWAIAVADFAFLGASMGSVFGEKLVRLIDFAIEYHLPLLTISTSGGARMHEGILSLMQMAKTTVALVRLSKAHLLHVSLLADPCYGGVVASYAMIADIILSEPGAMIGFAGPRVIEQTMHQALPSRFQTAEFQFEHGMIDLVLKRHDIAPWLEHLAVCMGQQHEPAAQNARHQCMDIINTHGHHTCESAINLTPRSFHNTIASNLISADENSWQRVQLARHVDRPHTLDLIEHLCSEFLELHGDRCFGDDGAIIGGLARFAGRKVMVIGHQKGRSTAENIQRNFGMPMPEGFRKACRLFKLAEKLALPVLCFIDTPGAYPGLQSEERGIAQAIANSLWTLADLRVPVISVVIGEGGSGGALALGLSDRILMLRNAIYTVASPEACASILWRDAGQAAHAATMMQITAQEILALGVIDEIVEEPAQGAHTDVAKSAELLYDALLRHLIELEQEMSKNSLAREILLEKRYHKFRVMGAWQEGTQQ